MQGRVLVGVRLVNGFLRSDQFLGNFPLAAFLMIVQTYFAGNVGLGVPALQIGENCIRGFVREECTLSVAACKRIEIHFSETVN